MVIAMATVFQAAAVENGSDMNISEVTFDFTGNYRMPQTWVGVEITTDQDYFTDDMWNYSVLVVGELGNASQRIGPDANEIRRMKDPRYNLYNPVSRGPFEVEVWLWESVGKIQKIMLFHNETVLDEVAVNFEYSEEYFKGNDTTIKFQKEASKNASIFFFKAKISKLAVVY